MSAFFAFIAGLPPSLVLMVAAGCGGFVMLALAEPLAYIFFSEIEMEDDEP